MKTTTQTNPKADAALLSLRYELLNGKHSVDGREGAVKAWIAAQGWELGPAKCGPTTWERRIVDQNGQDRGCVMSDSDHPKYAVAIAL
jgi:hypothetical protein